MSTYYLRGPSFRFIFSSKGRYMTSKIKNLCQNLGLWYYVPSLTSFFFIPEISVFLKTCQLSQQFFWETIFLLVKPIWGFEKHHLRSSFLLLQSDVNIFDQVSNFDFSAKNWKIRKKLSPPKKGLFGGVKLKNNFSQFRPRTSENSIKNVYQW